ncbi:Eukaryotic aspartyl protease [Rhizoctonia solani]|uniref:Eukaryotic aspartyl protease n=1 Tax=Rhizoctonia solani TaxID=456999 RepID=A0A8H7ILF6_9AGAM|nr:Eukaryotic aspartyl protease [Rhizoctonia solani]
MEMEDVELWTRVEDTLSTDVPTLDHKGSAVHIAANRSSRKKLSRGDFSFAYLAVCYVAATRIVPVSIWVIEEPETHLLNVVHPSVAIKAGVTTLNIVIIGLAMLPLKTLLDELKSEEFFRMLRCSGSGIPIKAVNGISIPSHSYWRGLLLALQRRASTYYSGALVVSFIGILISSLAPAALSVGLVHVDKEIKAFRVGAVAGDSIIVWVILSIFRERGSVQDNLDFDPRTTEAAAMGWVQGVLGMSVAFQATTPKYAVPVPLDLRPSDRARYITDVITMDPVCTWEVPDPPVVAPLNSPILVPGEFHNAQLWNRFFFKATIDMSGIPTQDYVGPLDYPYNGTVFDTLTFSILVCDPRLSIETREVRLDGSGAIAVTGRGGLTRQGNLHTTQTRLLVGKGPDVAIADIGKMAQAQMFFGPFDNATTTPVLIPRPVEALTQSYMIAQQAAMRSYLSGNMAWSFVPGRMQEAKLVFTSSPETEQFTLFSVAAVLADSSLGGVCRDVKYADCDGKELPEGIALKALKVLWTLFSYLLVADASKSIGWVSLPVHSPPRLDGFELPFSGADIAVGTPPQNTSFMIDTTSPFLYALTPDCVYCPIEGMYDPSLSSTSNRNLGVGSFGNGQFGGIRGSETVTLGGLLQAKESPLGFVYNMSIQFLPRFSGGNLGLLVPQLNQSAREKSLLYHLDQQGQLLNPVWGVRLTGADPRLTIGALDPNDYEGDINWVLAVNDSNHVEVEAIKGYNGNTFALEYPVTAFLGTLNINILLPDIDMYWSNASLIGPNHNITVLRPRNLTFGVECDSTHIPPIEFSVVINGVEYPVNQPDMVRLPASAQDNICGVGVMKATDSKYTLGLTFLRSVYLAYRFPTGTCPGYWGFAAPKDGPTRTSAQKPRTTPKDAATCLSFTKPSSTPAPTIAVGREFQPSGQKYSVQGQPDYELVELRGVDDLPQLELNGGIYGFGECYEGEALDNEVLFVVSCSYLNFATSALI